MALVLRHIIANAIQFRDAERPLVLTIRGDVADGGDVVITIDDTGQGIDPAQREEVFRPLRRIIRRDDGRFAHGLGLASVARVVSALGGSVWVTGDTGVGSRFNIRLPGAQT